MTELPSSDPKRPSRAWLVQTFGLAFGVAVVMVAIVFVGVLALESPSNRRPAVRAESLATPSSSAAEPLPEQAVTAAPTATAEPSPTPTVSPTATPAPTNTPFPTATSTPTSTPTATRAAATRTVAKAVVAKPQATATPVLPLDLYFYVKAYCHKSGESLQVVDLFLTAHGGVPPYDYYNDTTFIARDSGMVRFTMKATSGNPVPYKIIILDSSGQRYMNEFFYKTGVHCK